MNAAYIIKKPVLTEKSTIGSSDLPRYAFEVHIRADKNAIKAAVEELYKVKVDKVNTQVRKARDRMSKFGLLEGKLTKFAIVRLAEGQTIELV
ncbi:50S ribosomal protein L23 [soil metagenome]